MYNVQYTVYFTVSVLRQGPCIYIPQEQGGPVIPPGTGSDDSMTVTPPTAFVFLLILVYSRGMDHTENTVSVASCLCWGTT
jgi:hypothetical protein